MSNIAIAGGNGALGRTFLKAFHHEGVRPLILSRKKRDLSNPEEIEVLYRNVDGLRKVLEEKGIHTVICTFDMTTRGLGVSQMNLIKAAELSKCTKRFIPTGYAIEYPRSAVELLPQLKEHFACLDELGKTGLEWTVVVNGLFLDYYGMPRIETRLKRNVIVVDMEGKKAAIPGSGDVPVSFTYTGDLARFVVKLSGTRRWDRVTRVVGDTVSWKEFVGIAEEVTGNGFEVVYDSVEKLKRFEVSELSGHRELYEGFPKERLQWFLSIFELWTTDATSFVRREGSLNHMFPDIKAMTVREMLERCWTPQRKP